MESNKPLVSVVIPVYNVEKYVEKCLKSVQKQTYKNLEVWVINDGSTDNSAEVIKKIIEDDERFNYIIQENGGLSSARNKGIKSARGKYISFVDSDDWIDKNFINVQVEALEKEQADMAICNMNYVYEDGHYKENTPAIKVKETVNNKKAFEDLLIGKKFKFHAQNKIYKTKLFKENNVFYPLNKVYEDVFTTYRLIYSARKIVYINKNLYNYLQAREGSILNTKFNNKRFDIFEAMDKIDIFNQKNKIVSNKVFSAFFILNIVSLENYIAPIYYQLSKKDRGAIHRRIKEYINGKRINLIGAPIKKSFKLRYVWQKYFFNSYNWTLNFAKNGKKGEKN